MIEKWYCLKCDNCGEVINYWQEDTPRDAIEREKHNSRETGTIASWNGNCFCNAKCQKEWLERRRLARKNQKQMNKIMERF